MNLRPSDFAAFFHAVHGFDPFPWQQTLVDGIASSNKWPDVLDLPTGSGKTAALDAAVFHLALRVDAPVKAALRIALVVDRRLIVDDAFERAKKIASTLNEGTTENPVVLEVASRLQRLAGEFSSPLVVQRLRGGAPLEHDWARTPTQPTILCSTVDQVGSRLFFRGYGVSDRMKPVHAGLLGTDTLLLLDEAHLSEPFRQTLRSVCSIGRASIKVALLSATPGNEGVRRLTLSSQDWSHPRLRRRLETHKSVTLGRAIRGNTKSAALVFADEARGLATRLKERNVSPVAVGVVVNRVLLARDIFDALREDDKSDVVLMTGRARNVDRDRISDALVAFRTGNEEKRARAKSLFVVATQCLEVGVDLDLDGLVTQAASLDALRQRFGRLNRAGRPIEAEGVILARTEDIAANADDPVYGDRIRLTWEALQHIAEGDTVDFGLNAPLAARLEANGLNAKDLASKRPNAPTLMPAYLDLWSQTSPRPSTDPDISLFLHGPARTSAGVSVVWRADISADDLKSGEDAGHIKEAVRLFPPRAAEAIELPLWVVRAWLQGPTGSDSDMSDAPERAADRQESTPNPGNPRNGFRWAGSDDSNTGVVGANELRPGDLLVVPAQYGGCDEFGWAPDKGSPVEDVADEAAKPYRRRRFAVRVSRGMVTKAVWSRVSDLLAAEYLADRDLVGALVDTISTTMSDEVDRRDGALLELLKVLKQNGEGSVDAHFPYPGGRERGVILVAERGISGNAARVTAAPSTEHEDGSYTSSKPVLLDDHGNHVADFAKKFGHTLNLSNELVEDIWLAAWLHDVGKADPRFQAMLGGGDPWNRPDGSPLAKSGRSWSPQAWRQAGLPRGWRHEALSVRMARKHPRLAEAHDRNLVLWLIGTHHGLGRPFFSFFDPEPEQPLPPCLGVSQWQMPESEFGPETLAFNFEGYDWPAMFEELKLRYGTWGLAHLEAIIRLADHRASEQERDS